MTLKLLGSRRATARGWYVPADAAVGHPDQRIMEAAAVLPSAGAIGGWAAARVLGVKVLDGRGIWGGREEPVLLCLGPGQIRTRSGMSISRSPLPEHDVRIVAGIRLTTPLRTAFDGGGHRDIDIHTYDNIREERLEDYGLEVVRATSVDFTHRARTAGRIRRAYVRAARNDHAERRWSSETEHKM